MAVPIIGSIAIGAIATQIIVSLGISIVTFSGLNLIQNRITTEIDQQVSGLGLIYNIAAMGGFIDALNMMISAVAVRLAMKNLKVFRLK